MAIAKNQKNKIESLFEGHEYIIPTYQRKYSWDEDNWEDLWEDIIEAESIKNKPEHFLGTIILAEIEDEELSLEANTKYEIIDGQQRLTTLFILFHELLKKINNSEIKKEHERTFVGKKIDKKIKLSPLGKDKEFLINLVFDEKNAKPKNRSQKLMLGAKKYFSNMLKSYKDVEKLIAYIKKRVEVLVLHVDSQTEAIRMFEIINDRGKPLTYLDKTKSILMLYSEMYLKGGINSIVNDAFETIFDSFDNIKNIGEELGINYFIRDFHENRFLFQHYISYSKDIHMEYEIESHWNYRNNPNDIFKNFIKGSCDELIKNPKKLEKFILDYVEDFKNYSLSYSELLNSVTKNKRSKLFKLIVLLGFSATMFPLVVRINMKNNLNKFLYILEVVELRVYKIKGTNPLQDIYRLSADIQNLNEEEIKDRLIQFTERFMDDGNFRRYLDENIYRNPGLKYILWEYNEKVDNKTFDSSNYKLYQISDKEHIFSKQPDFGVTSYKFKKEDYDYEVDKIGNITLLEENINRSKDVANKSPKSKSSHYIKSIFPVTNKVGSEIKQNGFDRKSMNNRSEEIINFCIKRWEIK